MKQTKESKMSREKVGQWVRKMQSQVSKQYSGVDGKENLYAGYAYTCGRLESMLADALLTETGRQFVIETIEQDLKEV